MAFEGYQTPQTAAGYYGNYGGSKYYKKMFGSGGEGDSWNTGYGGSNPNFQGSFAKLGGGMPSMTPEDKAAIQWAFDQSSKMFDQGQGRLGSGQFMGGALAQGAQQNYLNPTGMDPATLERVKSELASMFSGAKKDQLANAGARANASGFGDSGGAQRLMQQIEAENAAGLVSAITGVLMNNEQYKLQQSGQAVPLLTNAQGLEAMMNQLAAQGYFGREFPIVPGMGEGMGGSGYKYIDPKTGGVTYQPPGGWSPAEYAAMQDERRRWMNQGGMAA